MPPAPGPAGMAPRLLELADELRSEGMAVGTSELLDAFGALDAVSWTSREDFFEALSATLAKSQEDRRVLELVFDRFFFRAVEREAVERGVTEGDQPEGRARRGSGSTSRRCAIASARRCGPRTAPTASCATSLGWPSPPSAARARAPG